MADVAHEPRVEFDTTPYDWKHWRLSIDGGVATLAMDVQEDQGFRPGYELKLNSYDVGVDIELYDAVTRLRFEQPQVRAVVVTSAKDRVFCAGANIKMLAGSSHPFKVNFCKYTNETRCSIEDATAHSDMTFVCAVSGACAGGGYELALACEEIYLIDDGSSAVSLPEVPLLGVLPGTGGLTRLVDKRKIRRDIADVFCTKAEGFKARDAKKYRFVDQTWPRSKWEAGVAARVDEIVAGHGGPGTETGIQLTKLCPELTDGDFAWEHVSLSFDAGERTATLTMTGPTTAPPSSHEELHALGDQSWALKAFRELEAAVHELRFNHQDIGLVLLHARGDAEQVMAWDAAIQALRDGGSWLAREIQLYQKRMLGKVDNMAKSLFAVIDEQSCFAGILFELALASDRSFMFLDEDLDNGIWVGPASFGAFPMVTGMTRLEARFYGEPEQIGAVQERQGERIDPEEAEELGLVTASPDDIDWEDELRIAIEERISLSPDGLTGMEQNLRFVGQETCESRIYGRLSAWQNWIFQRPNAVGPQGALTLYGAPERPVFDFRRV